MFGIGSTELLLIFVVGLIILGPKNLANMAKTLGKAMGEFRRVSTDFQRTINSEMDLEEHQERKKEAEKDLFPDSDKNSGDKKDSDKKDPKSENTKSEDVSHAAPKDSAKTDNTNSQEILSSAEKLAAEQKANSADNEEKA